LGGAGGEVAQQFAGGGVDDADVQVDQEQDTGCGVGTAGAEVVEAPAVAQGDLAGASMRSVRMRSWVSLVRSPGVALGRAW